MVSSQKAQVPNTGKDVEKRELYTLLEGMYIGAVTAENSMVFPQKTKNRITMWFSTSTGAYTWENENANSQRDTHHSVHSSIIYCKVAKTETNCHEQMHG